jgi:hypothetical protein
MALDRGHLATQYIIDATDFEVHARSVMRRLMCNTEVPGFDGGAARGTGTVRVSRESGLHTKAGQLGSPYCSGSLSLTALLVRFLAEISLALDRGRRFKFGSKVFL